MNGIQLLLITGLTLIAVYFFVRLQKSILDIFLFFGLLAIAVLFILFPSLTSSLAHKLGVGRGADLVFYISIILFWFVILKLYVRMRKLEQVVTRLVRKLALDSEMKDK